MLGWGRAGVWFTFGETPPELPRMSPVSTGDAGTATGHMDSDQHSQDRMHRTHVTLC